MALCGWWTRFKEHKQLKHGQETFHRGVSFHSHAKKENNGNAVAPIARVDG